MKTKTPRKMKPESSGYPKWLAGTAAAATAATTAHGGVVQITLTGNSISTSTGSHLNADVSGDSTNDLSLTLPSLVNTGFGLGAFVTVNGNRLSASSFVATSSMRGDALFAVGGVGTPTATGNFNIKYLNPITFTDARINGGAATQGYLEVNSVLTQSTLASIAFTRLVFDDASTSLAAGGLNTGTTYTEFVAVPEPSGLCLLTLGAGGILARRRRNR